MISHVVSSFESGSLCAGEVIPELLPHNWKPFGSNGGGIHAGAAPIRATPVALYLQMVIAATPILTTILAGTGYPMELAASRPGWCPLVLC
jgi:hypothetical protein